MNEKELAEMLEKVGYKLEKVVRFKNHDRVRVKFPKGRKLTITLTLKKHLEETPRTGLLGAILGEHWREIVK